MNNTMSASSYFDQDEHRFYQNRINPSRLSRASSTGPERKHSAAVASRHSVMSAPQHLIDTCPPPTSTFLTPSDLQYLSNRLSTADSSNAEPRPPLNNATQFSSLSPQQCINPGPGMQSFPQNLNNMKPGESDPLRHDAMSKQQCKSIPSVSSTASSGTAPVSVNTSRYKTELCRPFEESGECKYGEKCQFAHGVNEQRSLSRHPKYKSDLCRTFHSIGFCPYGPRCHFIHNEDERRLNQINQVKLQQELQQQQQQQLQQQRCVSSSDGEQRSHNHRPQNLNFASYDSAMYGYHSGSSSSSNSGDSPMSGLSSSSDNSSLDDVFSTAATPLFASQQQPFSQPSRQRQLSDQPTSRVAINNSNNILPTQQQRVQQLQRSNTNDSESTLELSNDLITALIKQLNILQNQQQEQQQHKQPVQHAITQPQQPSPQTQSAVQQPATPSPAASNFLSYNCDSSSEGSGYDSNMSDVYPVMPSSPTQSLVSSSGFGSDCMSQNSCSSSPSKDSVRSGVSGSNAPRLPIFNRIAFISAQ